MLQSLVEFCSVTSLCEAAYSIYRRWVNNYEGPILAVCGPKFLKFLGLKGTLCSSSDVLGLSIACSFPKIFAHKFRSRRKKRPNVYSFSPHFGRHDPTSFTTVCYRNLTPTVWRNLFEFRLLTSMCEAWQWSNLRMVDKNGGPISSRLWVKIHEILWRCKEPLCFPAPFPDCLHRVSFRRNWLLEMPLSCEVVKKFENRWCRWFLGEWCTPTVVGHALPNHTHFRTCGRFWLSSIQWAQRVADKQIEDKTGVKPNGLLTPPTRRYKTVLSCCVGGVNTTADKTRQFVWSPIVFTPPTRTRQDYLVSSASAVWTNVGGRVGV